MPLFVRRGLAVSTPARVRLAPSPSQQRARDRVKGLLTGVVMQAGMVLGLRVAQAGIVEDDPGRGLATLEHRVAALDGR